MPSRPMPACWGCVSSSGNPPACGPPPGNLRHARPGWSHCRGREGHFRAACFPCERRARAAPAAQLRAQVLQPMQRPRHDDEGIERADVEAASSPAWKSWRSGPSPTQRTQLSVWRSGAVWTPTRRFRGDDPRAQCPRCSAPLASARRLWAESPTSTACAPSCSACTGSPRAGGRCSRVSPPNPGGSW